VTPNNPGFKLTLRNPMYTYKSNISKMVWYGIVEFNIPLDTV